LTKGVTLIKMEQNIAEKTKKFLPAILLMFSFYYSVIFTAGAISAYFLVEFLLRKFWKTGKMRLMIFNFKGWEVHIHHWFWPACVIIIAGLSSFLSLPIFIAGFLSGLIFHDIYTEKKWSAGSRKWYEIIYKK